MSTSDLTGAEFFETLNGFDEQAIAKKFGKGIRELTRTDELGTLRALVFIDTRRRGSNDPEAYKAAMELRIGDLKSYFADPDDEDDRDPFDPQAG